MVGGDPTRRIVELEDPLAAAKKWEEQGASLLHVIDLDGAIEGIPANMGIVTEIVNRLGIPVQFGGGIRSTQAAGSLLETGIHRVILGTLALKEPRTVAALSSEYGPDRVMVALDFREGRVLTHGWRAATDSDPISAAREFENLGAGSILHTNVEVEGKLGGIPLEPIRQMVRAVGIDIIASGGISSIGDVLSVKGTGAAGAIVGAAIYTGRINLEEAIRAAEG